MKTQRPPAKTTATAPAKAKPAPVRSSRYVKPATVSVKTQLNLRSGPGTEYGVVGKLAPGAPLTTAERSNQTANRPDKDGKFRWYKVRVGGQEGWVWGGYLNMGGVTPQKREWRRSPSSTPAEAKAKGRTILPPQKINSLLAAYRERLRKAAAQPPTAPVKPAKPTATTTPPTPKPTTAVAPGKKPAEPRMVSQTTAPTGGACLNACLDLKSFKPYSQGDDRWASQSIGTSKNRNIRQVGCCLTSWSMALQFYGKDLPPDKLNQVLKEKGAFDGAMLNQAKIAEVVGLKVKDTRDVNKSWEQNQDRALAAIKENFSRKPPRPMLLQVDYNSDKDKAGNHFVTVTGIDEKGDPIIYDPGDSKNRGVPLSQVKTHGGYAPLRALVLEGDPN